MTLNYAIIIIVIIINNIIVVVIINILIFVIIIFTITTITMMCPSKRRKRPCQSTDLWINSIVDIPPCHHRKTNQRHFHLSTSVSSTVHFSSHHDVLQYLFSHYISREQCLSLSNGCVQCSTLISPFQTIVFIYFDCSDHCLYWSHKPHLLRLLVLLICSFTFPDSFLYRRTGSI